MKHFFANDPFGIYTARIYYDWLQARDEGKDVDAYKDICRNIQDSFLLPQRSETEKFLELADKLHDSLCSAALIKDYPFDEPSEYKDILSSRPVQTIFRSNVESDRLYDRIYAGWAGRIAGCLLGKPLEFWKRGPLNEMLKEIGNYPITRYVSSKDFDEELIRKHSIKIKQPAQPWIDEIGDCAPIDDDTNYTVLNLKVLHTYGRDFQPNDVLYSWVNWMPAGVFATAERITYANALRGMLAPGTAVYKNPFREWVGAQIRAEIFGFVNPGNPEAAAEMAFRDASISHVKNGIYGEMFTAGMVASAFVYSDAKQIILAGLGQIPKNSRLALAISEVIKWYEGGISHEESVNRIHDKYNENDIFDWCHILPNASIVALSLLYSEGSFTSALSCSMLPAFDTDSNGAVVGAIMGTMLGTAGIPKYWVEGYNGRLMSSVSDYELMSLEELTNKTLEVVTGNLKLNEDIRNRYSYYAGFEG